MYFYNIKLPVNQRKNSEKIEKVEVRAIHEKKSLSRILCFGKIAPRLREHLAGIPRLLLEFEYD